MGKCTLVYSTVDDRGRFLKIFAGTNNRCTHSHFTSLCSSLNGITIQYKTQCKPAFAKKMIEALDGRKNGEPHSYVPVHRYIEIENAGHCPNHEAPQAVAHLLRSWVDGGESNGGGRGKEQLTLVDGGGGTKKLVFQEDWGATSAAERSAQDICLGVMDRLATTFL